MTDVVIRLPNGFECSAIVYYRRGWTRIVPERGLPIAASEFGQEQGDAKDYIYDLDIRGEHSPDEMVRKIVAAWLRDSEWAP